MDVFCAFSLDALASGTTAGTAVYDGQAGPANITQAGGLSPFGVMGLGGNVYEWKETETDLVNESPSSYRGFRGGSWLSVSGSLSSSGWVGALPAFENNSVGFRVASLSSPAVVPEPSSFALLLIGMAGLGWYGRRRVRK